MESRINKITLIEILKIWSQFIRRKVHLIACGGTAMTLLEVKESTKDIDFMVPEIREYNYLIKIIKQLGYQSVTTWGWKRKNYDR